MTELLSTNTLVVAPMQWSSLKDIDAIKPIDNDDTDCLIEVREVLRKHCKLERFGIALLHSHFSLDAGEVMLEESDERTRTLTLKPVKQSEIGRSDIGTIWMLQDSGPEAVLVCRQICKRDIFHRHTHSVHVER
jgi:hypothetical protein